MAEMMVGKSLAVPARAASAPGAVLLSIDALTLPAATPFGTPLKDVSLAVHAGEVLGIGGVAGNGQDELLAVLSGERRTPSGKITFEGRDIGADGPTARRAVGLLSAPEERLGHAAAPDMSLTENAVLTASARKSLAKNGFISWPRARAFADEVIARFDVRTPGNATAARALSGGNLQKFVIGREILQDPRVLVVNQPTWGVDASAAADIRQALLTLTEQGAAVIVISQDLDELLEISDQFCALNEGRLSAPRPARDLSMEEIGLMLGGAHGMQEARTSGAHP
jgi:simple sugar transport system ATP-binding protein